MTTQLAVRNGADISIQDLGGILVKSGYFGDTREVAQAVVKVLAGRELGFGPIASMQGVYIVKGRVTLSANLVGAAIQRSGRYRYRVTRLDDKACSIDFYEGQAKIGDSTFTFEDAQKAQLQAGDNWRKYPRNMLFARALTNGARWYCPDVFNGPIYTPDELGEVVDEEGLPVATEAKAAEYVPFREQDPAEQEGQDDQPGDDEFRAALAERMRLAQQTEALGGRAKALPENATLEEVRASSEKLQDWLARRQAVETEQEESAKEGAF